MAVHDFRYAFENPLDNTQIQYLIDKRAAELNASSYRDLEAMKRERDSLLKQLQIAENRDRYAQVPHLASVAEKSTTPNRKVLLLCN